MTLEETMAELLRKRTDYAWDDNLPARLSSIIRDAQASSKRQKPWPRDIDWGNLGRIIETYLEKRADILGYLDKTQARVLLSMAEHADRLLKDIRRLTDEDGLWYVIRKLEEEGFDEAARARAVQCLNVVSQIEPRSLFLSARNKSEVAVGTEEDCREALQISLDAWWTFYTGLPKDISKDFGTPYSLFLTELFRPFRLHNAPGASRTAVQVARNTRRSRDEAFDGLFVRFAKAMERLKTPTKGGKT